MKTTFVRLSFCLLLASLVLSGCSKNIFAEMNFSDDGSGEEGNLNAKMESFEQKPFWKKLDLLIVIDNSDSMYMDYYRGAVQKALGGFLSTLEGVDYQIAFTTTDSREQQKAGWGGQIGHILTPEMIYKEVFFNAYLKGEDVRSCREDMGPNCGSNEEQPLKATMKAIQKKDGLNEGFLRDDADFVVLVITDENEEDLTPEGTVKPEQALQYLRSVLGPEKVIRFYGVVIKPGDADCFSRQKNQEFLTAGAQYGIAVTEAAKMTGGSTVSICDKNWTAPLAQIAESATLLGQKTFTLSEKPKKQIVKVETTPKEDIAYKTEGNVITFESAPSEGTLIEVTYE